MSSLPGVIHQGELGIFRKGKVDFRYFVLFKDHLDYYGSVEDAKPDVNPKGCLALPEVEEIAVVEIADGIGMRIRLEGGPKRTLQLMVKEKDLLKPWIDALEPLLGDDEEGEDSEPQEDPDQVEDDDSVEEVILSTYLKVEVKGTFTQKYFWLFADRIEFTNAEDDEDVEGTILLPTISSVTPSEGGFTIIAGERKVMFTCNAQDAALWARELKKACKAVKKGTEDSGASPRPAASPPPAAAAARPPAVVVSSPSGEIKTLVEEKFDDSDKPPEGTGKEVFVDGPPVFCKGVLEIFRKGRVDERFFVLFNASFEYWNTEADYDAGLARNGCIVAGDIAKLEDNSTGFIVNIRGDDRALQLRCGIPSMLTKWLAAWQKVLPASACTIRDTSVAAALAQSQAVASGAEVVFGGLKCNIAGKALPKLVVKGELQMLRKSTAEKRYFVLFSDRLEYYNSAADYDEGAKPRGMVVLKDVTGFSILPEGVEFVLGERSIQLLSDSRDEREMWADGWADVFILRPVGSEEAKAESKAVPPSKQQLETKTGSVPEVAVATPLYTTPVKTIQAQAETSTGEKTRPAVPESQGPPADSKSPLPDLADLVHMGTLSIERKGKRGDSRHFAIFPTSLQYWNSASDLTAGREPRGQIALRDITQFTARDMEFELCVLQDRWLVLVPEKGEMPRWALAFTQVGLPNPDDVPLRSPRQSELKRNFQGSLRDSPEDEQPRSPRAELHKKDQGSPRTKLKKKVPARAGASAIITLDIPPGDAGNPAAAAKPDRGAGSGKKKGGRTLSVTIDPEAFFFDPEAINQLGSQTTSWQSSANSSPADSPRLSTQLQSRPSILLEGSIGLLTSTSKPEQRHLVIFRDRLDCFTDASKNDSPLESVLKKDLEAIDVVDNGFDIGVGGQERLRFRVLPGMKRSVDEWSIGLSSFLEAEEEYKTDEASTKFGSEAAGVLWQSLLEVAVDGSDNEVAYCVLSTDAFMIFQDPEDFANGQQPQMNIPLSRIRDLEVIGLGFGLILDQGESIMVSAGSEPGRLDSWLQTLKKVVNISAMSVGRRIPTPSERHAILKKPLTSPQGQQSSQAVLYQGLLEMEKGSEVEMRYIVMYQDRLDNHTSRARFKSGGYPPKSSWQFNNFQEIQLISQGFYILHGDVSVRFHANSMADFEGWKNALGELFHLDGLHDSSADDVVHQGPLAILEDGRLRRHHFVIHSDRIDYYVRREDVEMKGQIRLDAVQGFKILDDRFILRLDSGEMELRVMNPGKDMSHWLTAFRNVFTGEKPQAKSTVSTGPGTPVRGGNVQGDGRAQSPRTSPQTSPRTSRQPVQESVPIHQGPLGIQHAGRLVRKFFVLYPDRLDYFDTAVEAVSGETPLGRIALVEVMGKEVFGVGLILDVCGRKVGLKPDHEADLMEWDRMLNHAMGNLRPPGSSPSKRFVVCGKGMRSRTESPTRKQMANTQSDAGPGGGSRQQSPNKNTRGRSRSPSIPPVLKGRNGGIRPVPHRGHGSKDPISLLAVSPNALIRSDWGTVGECVSPGRDIGNHTDSEGWVHIPLGMRASGNGFLQVGGRPWRPCPLKNVAEHEVALQTVVPDAFVYLHKVSPKITGERDHDCIPLTSIDQVLQAKVNVPYEEARRSIRDVHKEKCARHSIPAKVTTKTTYGTHPTFITTTDRTYLRCASPNRQATTDKITNSPAGMANFARGN